MISPCRDHLSLSRCSLLVEMISPCRERSSRSSFITKRAYAVVLTAAAAAAAAAAAPILAVVCVCACVTLLSCIKRAAFRERSSGRSPLAMRDCLVDFFPAAAAAASAAASAAHILVVFFAFVLAFFQYLKISLFLSLLLALYLQKNRYC
jgi:hypothetical protein